ncbi:acyl-CoA dehydrogenase family protein [Tepidimonas sp.]|uniref:acyl-CoA dehydrogenase family protein n=1 Tax=Tepidimonas sp. TaxID=2002775 RepID=UPI002FE1AFCC
MDFDFSDEQRQLRDAVARWAERAYPFEQRRAIIAAGGFDARIWRDLTDLGLTGLTVAETHGGMGQGPVEALLVLETLGTALLLEPLAATWVAAALLQDCADGALPQAWLPRLAAGDLVVPALLERRSRHDLPQVACQANADGNAWRLSGRKHVVPAGDQAAAWLVSARAPDGVALFLVERSAAGIATTPYPLQDGSRAADLHLNATPAQRLPGDGATALAWAADVGAALACAQAVGVMERALALTVEYLNTRRQFGVPIGSFQVLRHRAADMKMALELARGMAYYALLKLDAPQAERRQAVARAKVQVGQSARFVGQQAVQLHGGIGVTDEYVVSHCFKTLTQLELSWGDTLHHLGTVAAVMGEDAAVGA